MLPSLANLTNYSNVIGDEGNDNLVSTTKLRNNDMIQRRMAAVKDWRFWLLIALSVLFIILIPITISITKNIQFSLLTIGFLCFAGLAIARFMHVSKIQTTM